MKKSALPLRFSENLSNNTEGIATSQLPGYFEDWLSYGDLELHSPRTIAQRRIYTSRLLRFLWANGHAACGRTELRQFFAGLVNQTTGEAMRPSTADTYHRNLSAFWNWMVEEGELAESPMRRIPKPRVPKDQVQPLSQSEIDALIEAARNSRVGIRNTAMILFMLDTGVRATELCTIHTGDVDIRNRKAIVTGKGNKQRAVFFGKRTARALYRYVPPQRMEDAARWLFVGESGPAMGEPMTRSGVFQVVHQCGRAAGITGTRCSPHTLRHTFAVSYLRNGGNVLSLKLMLGHESLSVSSRYVAFAEADLEAQHRTYSPVDLMSHKAR